MNAAELLKQFEAEAVHLVIRRIALHRAEADLANRMAAASEAAILETDALGFPVTPQHKET